METHEEDDREHGFKVLGGHGEGAGGHGDDFGGLHPAEEGGLADGVGEAAGDAGEEEEGREERGDDQGQIGVAEALFVGLVNGDEGDENFEAVVVEGEQALADPERNEARFAGDGGEGRFLRCLHGVTECMRSANR